MPLEAVIYDWDGTIINSGHQNCIPRLEGVLTRHGFVLDEAAHKRMDASWGLAGDVFISNLLGVSLEEGKRLYEEWEDTEIKDPYDFIPGTVETLELLRDCGYCQSIVSSRRRERLLPYLPLAKVFDSFVSITCGDDVGIVRKPDGRAFDSALAQLAARGVGKEACVYVGDTAQDFHASKKAGIRVVIVETGPYRKPNAEVVPIDEGDVIPSIADLPAWLGRNY